MSRRFLDAAASRLGPAATPGQIAEAKSAFGGLPESLAALWAEAGGSDPLISGVRLLAPHESVALWRGQLEFVDAEGLDGEQVAGPCHEKVFDRRWIPFACDGETRTACGSGDVVECDLLYCVDGYPSAEGQMNQVICVHHLEGLHGRESESLQAFLNELADAIERDPAREAGAGGSELKARHGGKEGALHANTEASESEHSVPHEPISVSGVQVLETSEPIRYFLDELESVLGGEQVLNAGYFRTHIEDRFGRADVSVFAQGANARAYFLALTKSRLLAVQTRAPAMGRALLENLQVLELPSASLTRVVAEGELLVIEFPTATLRLQLTLAAQGFPQQAAFIEALTARGGTPVAVGELRRAQQKKRIRKVLLVVAAVAIALVLAKLRSSQ